MTENQKNKEIYKNTPFIPENYQELVTEECPMCFDLLYESTNQLPKHTPIELVNCSHRFHKDCIDDWCGNTKMGAPCLCPVCKENVKGPKPYYKYLMPEFNRLKKEVEQEEPSKQEELLKQEEPSKQEEPIKQESKKKREKKVEPQLTEDELLNQAITSVQQTTIFDDKNIPGVSEERIKQIDAYLFKYFKTMVRPGIENYKRIPEKAEMVRQMELLLDAYNILTNKRKSNEEKKQELYAINDVRLYIIPLELDLLANALMYRYQLYEPNLIYDYFNPEYYINYLNSLTPTESENAAKKSGFFYKQKIVLFYPNHTLNEKKNAEKILKQLVTKPFYLNPLIEMYLRIFETQVWEEVEDPYTMQNAGKKRKTKRRYKRTNKRNKSNKKTKTKKTK